MTVTYNVLEIGKFIKGFAGNAARCKCSCGSIFVARMYDLTHKKIVSCGCKKRTHGKRSHPLYQTWHGVMLRCNDTNSIGYEMYGGRGILLCPEWHDVSIFIRDIEREIGARPVGLQLDRKNNAKGYEPGNVHWVTPTVNSRNTRRNRVVSVNGVSKCVAEWAEETGIAYTTLLGRLNSGKTGTEFISPVRQKQ